MTAHLEVYEEVANLLAQMDPAKVVALKASPKRRRRLEHLLDKNRTGNLSLEEELELERFLLLNRVISLAKIRAKRLLEDAPENLS